MDEISISGMQSFVIPAMSDIPSAGMSKTYEGNFDGLCITYGPFAVRIDEGSHYAITLSNTGKGLAATGSLKGLAVTQCARCLEDAFVDISEEVEGFFIRETETLPEGMEEDEIDYINVSGEVDLFTCITSTLIYALPQDPLCKEDCKGLCSHCGANLNEETCSCIDEIDPASPFAALKDWGK